MGYAEENAQLGAKADELAAQKDIVASQTGHMKNSKAGAAQLAEDQLAGTTDFVETQALENEGSKREEGSLAQSAADRNAPVGDKKKILETLPADDTARAFPETVKPENVQEKDTFKGEPQALDSQIKELEEAQQEKERKRAVAGDKATLMQGVKPSVPSGAPDSDKVDAAKKAMADGADGKEGNYLNDPLDKEHAAKEAAATLQ
ncbi:Hypothetical Protein FCC1311_062692 [Hondaea fermentalgiana]|uniref:Uncharacterized protein n=1 Tax=Hondaea fermentalgiana TaxID=2315210 RepID=A0A2R5GIA7_9STRA|nr:Hypothetical Protein FCC1311_062692 [Hondaea fermentalgiana]|eukprot:GBG30049.1 Hypothetical Protein FCC1311_062692 [Hondaea fermentalgiana]